MCVYNILYLGRGLPGARREHTRPMRVWACVCVCVCVHVCACESPMRDWRARAVTSTRAQRARATRPAEFVHAVSFFPLTTVYNT